MSDEKHGGDFSIPAYRIDCLCPLTIALLGDGLELHLPKKAGKTNPLLKAIDACPFLKAIDACSDDCGGCSKQECNKAEKVSANGATYPMHLWQKSCLTSGWIVFRKETPQSEFVPVFSLRRIKGDTWGCQFEGNDASISIAQDDKLRFFEAGSPEEAKRYVDANILPRIRVGAAEVPKGKQDSLGSICGFNWYSIGKVEVLQAIWSCKVTAICRLTPCGKENTYTSEWLGVFGGDTNYSFYATSLDAAKQEIEKKVKDKIDGNVDKWLRLREEWHLYELTNK